MANDSNFASSISADGTRIAFNSHNLDNDRTDVFVRDLTSGRTVRVSVGTNRQEANHEANEPIISGDGETVAFQSYASNLVPDDGDFTYDITFWPGV